MRIDQVSILCGKNNPVSLRVARRIMASFPDKVFQFVFDYEGCRGGDILIALSYPRLVPKSVRSLYSLALVLHASPVPIGRGWSPANWMLENLETQFTISLLEMGDGVDEGRVMAQAEFEFPISGLWASFSNALEKAQFGLLKDAISGEIDFDSGVNQTGKGSYFRRRTPSDSKIDPSKSLKSQWGVIRAADPIRFPNYFFLHGTKYKLYVEEMGEDNEDW